MDFIHCAFVHEFFFQQDCLSGIQKKRLIQATFDPVVHELLMTRLEQSFGITNKVHTWLRSYISEWNQMVVVGSVKSVVQSWHVACHKGWC